MSRIECTHEPLVVDAVLSGAWPERADTALVAHADTCDICREVATIATLIHDDHERARFDVHVPAAGQVWWRSAIRARLESTQAAVRPMSWMHAVTGAIAIGVLLAILTVAWPMLSPLAGRAWVVVVEFFPNAEVASALASGLRLSAMLGLAAAALLLLAPLALYFALSASDDFGCADVQTPKPEIEARYSLTLAFNTAC